MGFINTYLKNLNRIEFIVTYACTGRCKHCSVGECQDAGAYIPADIAEKIVFDVAKKYNIQSVMTFGGEPLLYPETVCAVFSAATKMQIPKRQLITNGFFSRDEDYIKSVVSKLQKSGVNDVLVSVDAFHQETIPIEPVRLFATELEKVGIPVRLNPAWLVARDDNNPYNKKTSELVEEFKSLGIKEGDGNIVFPEGNAKKYLSEYFDKSKEYINPYEESPTDLKSISIEPDGGVLGRNIHEEGIDDILEKYNPYKGE